MQHSRAMEALGERNIGKSMLMSMAGAGLIGGGPITDGLSTGELITAYAKHELLKASVNATLAATIDGQDLGQAMLQGVVMAGINTAAAFGAHKIGDLQKPASVASTSSAAAATAEPIGYTTHKLLHTALGTGLGASMAAVTDQDIGKGAASGGFGALVGSIMTDAMVDDKDPPVTAQRMAQMSDLLTATLALGVGLEPVSAYLAAHNASEHNALKHRPYLESIGMVEEDEDVYEGEEPSGRESPSVFSARAIEEYQEGIEKERALRQGDISATEKLASHYREWGLKCAIGEAQEVISQRSVHKATERALNGTATGDDQQLLFMGVAQIIGSGIAARSGCKGGGPKIVVPKAVRLGGDATAVGSTTLAKQPVAVKLKAQDDFHVARIAKHTETGRMYGAHKDLNLLHILK